MIMKICENPKCHKEFEQKSHNQRYCCNRCRDSHARAKRKENNCIPYSLKKDYLREIRGPEGFPYTDPIMNPMG